MTDNKKTEALLKKVAAADIELDVVRRWCLRVDVETALAPLVGLFGLEAVKIAVEDWNGHR